METIEGRVKYGWKLTNIATEKIDKYTWTKLFHWEPFLGEKELSIP